MEFATPLPDFSQVALQGHFDLAGRRYTLQVSPLRHYADYGPDFAVVHLQVTHGGVPLALADLGGAFSAGDCYHLWSDLCGTLQATVQEAFALAEGDLGEENPRLGCWGARPDLADLGDSDCTTALVLGIGVDTSLAGQQPGSALLAQQLAAAVLRVLRRWEAAAANA